MILIIKNKPNKKITIEININSLIEKYVMGIVSAKYKDIKEAFTNISVLNFLILSELFTIFNRVN